MPTFIFFKNGERVTTIIMIIMMITITITITITIMMG